VGDGGCSVLALPPAPLSLCPPPPGDPRLPAINALLPPEVGGEVPAPTPLGCTTSPSTITRSSGSAAGPCSVLDMARLGALLLGWLPPPPLPLAAERAGGMTRGPVRGDPTTEAARHAAA
jgi:hypothetical protein